MACWREVLAVARAMATHFRPIPFDEDEVHAYATALRAIG